MIWIAGLLGCFTELNEASLESKIITEWISEWMNEQMNIIKDTFHIAKCLRLEISTGESGGNHRS